MSSSYPTTGYGDYANPRLESHMSFVCPECGVEFATQQDWRRHLNEEHNYIQKTPADFDFKVISESFHECQVCHKWVANANQAIALLQYHRFLHLPFNRTYRCRHCKGGFTRKRALCEHLYRFHSRQIVMAEKQRQQTESETATPHHQQQQRNPTDQRSLKDPRINPEFYLRFICPHCGRNIDKYEQWLKHLDFHQSTSTDLRMHRISGSRNHYCLQCRKLLYTNEQQKLQRHRFTHLPFRLYFKCAFCMVKKSFKSEIFRHFVYAHPRQFNDAKSFIKKPIEWGAKINDRLNVELDAILKRNRVGDGSSNSQSGQMLDTTEQRRSQKKQTYASEKARLAAIAAPRQKCEQPQQKAASNLNRKNNVRIIKDYHTSVQKLNSATTATSTESTTEDDFEELCADVFESIEEESQPQQSSIDHNAGVGLNDNLNGNNKHGLQDSPSDKHAEKRNESNSNNNTNIKVEHFKQEQYTTDEELVISIEIDTMNDDDDDDNRTKMGAYNFIRTSPRKRLKLSESKKLAPIIKSEKDEEEEENNNPETTSNSTNESNKKALLESNIHYLCPECGNEFNEQSSWRTHVFNEHNIENAIQTNFQMLENKESYLCLDCMDVQHTTKHAELQRHRFMHMPYQSYLKCKICSKTKSSKPKMLQHLQEFHNECFAGSGGGGGIIKKRKRSVIEQQDEQQQPEKEFYPCKNCNKYFISKERLKLHRTQASEVLRANGSRTNICRNNANSTVNASIDNNMRLLAHLKKAHARMKRMLTAETS